MDTVNPEHTKLNRIYLWANNRSMGTVFLKWLSLLPNSQAVNGMFTSCYFYGPESRWIAKDISYERSSETNLPDYPFVYDASNVTYRMAKTNLESDYPGKKYLFCKDLPYCLFHNHKLIPKGFRHTFLIRHPYRMYPSWKKAFGGLFQESSLNEIIEKHYHHMYNYKEQYEIIQYLQNNPELGDTDPVIFDADDLQNHPESILRQYCQAVGIAFTESMLQWSPGVEVVKSWKISKQLLGGGIHESDYAFYRTAMESSKFLPPKKLPERCELDEDILECADIGMPYYEKLYAMRTLRP
ncbi:uncharacterized protein [Amphiura filiformis]|uniref:uncharacterized protein n=1 Tax=Amphiura filiformis TaxID=82378 RepID=UPI003B21C55E